MTVSTEVEICNLALDRVKEAPINAIDGTDNRAAARWMGRNFATVRDMTLAQFPWRFAVSRAQIANTVTPAPEFGWTNRFPFQTNACGFCL